MSVFQLSVVEHKCLFFQLSVFEHRRMFIGY